MKMEMLLKRACSIVHTRDNCSLVLVNEKLAEQSDVHRANDTVILIGNVWQIRVLQNDMYANVI